MANYTGNAVTPFLALLVGGLIVAVIGLAIFLYSGIGQSTPSNGTVVINVNHPANARHDWWHWRTDLQDRNGPGDHRDH
jgi:hypothetical protein